MQLGYWLSSEEHGPHELVRGARFAESVGFTTALISDHFHPWTREQGESPFVWGVLGAISEATSTLRVGTGVTTPIIRMHPVIVAQAAATAAVQLEGRFFLGLGSGERLNEHVTGQRWPPGPERRDMLREAVGVIRELLAGGNVNHRGDYFTVENAELFTLPATPPELLMAAGGTRSARLAGEIGDGLLATSPNARVVEAFEATGGAGKRRAGQLHVCWATTDDEARITVAKVWPIGGVKGGALSDLARPADFETVTAAMTDDARVGATVCGPDPARHIEAIARFAAAGFTEVYVHQIGPDQEGFFRFYADHVLPAVG